MSDRRLNVWYQDLLVGQVWRDITGKIGFRYHADWLVRGFSISQQLPLSKQEYPSFEGVAHLFFANLLPEANAREHIVKALKITNDDFTLLEAIGGECAGALSLLPINEKVKPESSYRKLDDQALTTLLLRRGYPRYYTNPENRPRLSLAGAQDKYAVYYDGSNYFESEGNAPSTHIMKFEISGYKDIPAYEYYLTTLAGLVGLPTVNCQLKKLGKNHFLLVERYDRIQSADKKIKRLHQEDFLQALGVNYSDKYQANNGPSFQDCYLLIQNISHRPIDDAEQLINWLVFNFLTGNSDAHAKNLAILYEEEQRIRLAPFYDLVCTRAVDGIDTRLAQAIGGEYNPDLVSLIQWEALSKAINVRYSYLRHILKELADKITHFLPITRETIEHEIGEYPALQRVENVVNKQCQRVLRWSLD